MKEYCILNVYTGAPDSGGTYQRREKEHPKKTTNHTYVDVNQTTIRWWLPLICFKMLLLTTIRCWLPLTCFKMLLLTTIRWWLPLTCFKMLLLTTIRWWLPLTCFKMLLLTTIRWWLPLTCFKMLLLAIIHWWQPLACLWHVTTNLILTSDGTLFQIYSLRTKMIHNIEAALY